MRKLRNLWCSHKKYCTTSVARSYTPLSGYPNSSYDLDRTYYTSTPYKSRFRRDEREDLLSKDFSDLSIDRIDSDDDPEKVKGLEIDFVSVGNGVVNVAFCMEAAHGSSKHDYLE